jgi:hypothetical protein
MQETAKMYLVENDWDVDEAIEAYNLFYLDYL